jgi:arginine/ornithine transport system permease protein
VDKFLEHFIEGFKRCLLGLPDTMLLTFISVVIGFFIAVLLAIPRMNKRTIGGKAVGFFTYVFTGTPLLVQMYIIYYGLPEFGWVQKLQEVNGFGFMRDGFFWACLALTLNTAAYSTEIIAGSLRNTPHGEMEAATAYGMSPVQVMKHVILPSGLRRALPAYSNEVIMLMQSTSLASTITLMEITGEFRAFYSKTLDIFPVAIAAGIIYLCLTMLFVGGFKLLEKRYMGYLRRSAH